MARAKAAPSKKRVGVSVDCDTSRLYGPIKDAIKYLQEVAAAHPGIDIQLNEEWTGYEDMHLEFQYSREETDEEFAQRLEDERAQSEREAREAARAAERREKERQFEQLRRELGR